MQEALAATGIPEGLTPSFFLSTEAREMKEWKIDFRNKLSGFEDVTLIEAKTAGEAGAKFKLMWRGDAEVISVERYERAGK